MTAPDDTAAPEPMYGGVWVERTALLVCRKCGTVVWPDPDATVDVHAEWHDRIDRIDSNAFQGGGLIG